MQREWGSWLLSDQSWSSQNAMEERKFKMAIWAVGRWIYGGQSRRYTVQKTYSVRCRSQLIQDRKKEVTRSSDLYEYRITSPQVWTLSAEVFRTPYTQGPLRSHVCETCSNNSSWLPSLPPCCLPGEFVLLLTPCVSLITGPLSWTNLSESRKLATKNVNHIWFLRGEFGHIKYWILPQI